MNQISIGVLLNSALYLAGCVAAGLVTGNTWAWRLALAALGATYISYALQIGDHRMAAPAVWLSIGLGFAAGLKLLWPL